MPERPLPQARRSDSGAFGFTISPVELPTANNVVHSMENNMIRRNVAALITLLITSALLTGTVSAGHLASPGLKSHKKLFPVTVTDDLGTKVTIARQPKRLISLDPRDTETLFALGLERRVVADGGKFVEGAHCCTTKFSYPSQWPSPWGADYPSKAKTLPHVEGGFGNTPFDYELIVKEKPDLILSLNSDAATLQKLRDLGLKLIVLDPHSLKDTEKDIALVGRATGAVNQSKTVLNHIKRRLKSVQKRLRVVKDRPTVYYEIDDSTGTPYTACKGSFIDELITLAKAQNIGHDVQPCPAANPYPQMSAEALIARNPQYILLGDANYGTTVDQVKSRNGWSAISAVQTGKIYPVDDDLISRAGPREIVGLEAVARLLHPAAFKK